jgi:hypothetical protein
MEANQLHNSIQIQEEIKRNHKESTSTFYDNRTSYTDNKGSRIGNLIKKSLSNNEFVISELNENYETFFKPVNFIILKIY